jgi:2-amino-4-hydroxy-6-hydroxymethyldihydropteridine diphosphokinase
VPRFSDRTLDVDIVLFGDQVLQGPGNLEIPRPELKYAFVLKPLADIAADVVHPVLGKTIGQLWRKFPQEKDHSERVADL